MKKYLLLCLISCGFTLSVRAQQDPLYGLYLTNPITLNPAYTGLSDKLVAFTNYRQQWAGFEGNPTTIAAGGHVSLRKNTMGLGLQIVKDEIGENSNTSVGALYSYRIRMGEGVLSFGMQAGFINYSVDPSQLNIRDAGDASFAPFNEMKFNAGAGVILKSERYLIGLSVPRLVNNAIDIGGADISIYEQHYYLFTSRIFYINEQLSFKPSVMLKAVKAAPLSTDVNLNLIVNKKYSFGAYTRNLNAYGAIAQIDFLNRYRMAYAFEIPSGKTLGARFTTHELMLSIQMPVFDSHDDFMSNF